jgi:hypothetical protein
VGEPTALTSSWCCVLQKNVTRVTNLEGEIVSVICPEFQVSTGICRLKEHAFQDGLLSELLRRVDENAIENPEPRCMLA